MSSSAAASTTHRVPVGLAALVLVLAVAQAATPALSTVLGGAQPDESTVDLLITPAGWTFSIWGLIYLLAIVTALAVLVRRSTGSRDPRRLLVALAVAQAGAALWIVFSANQMSWFTSVTLTVMVVALLDAARTAAGPTGTTEGDESPRWLTLLVRTTVGIYAAWATAAVFQNWASDLAEATLDPTDVRWQLVLLVGSVVLGAAVTVLLGGRLPGYPLTLLWALTGILAEARGDSAAVLVTAVAGMVVVLAALVVALRRERSLAP